MPRWSKIGIVVVFIAMGIAAVVIATHWPFTQAAVTQALEQNFASTVEVKTFRVSYFAPGCVMEGVTLRRNSDTKSDRNGQGSVQPIATVERLAIEGSYAGFFMFPKRIARVKVEGLHVFASPQSERAGAESHAGGASDQTRILIGEINADDALLEFASGEPDADPLRFEIHRLTLNAVSDDRPMSFHVALKIPQPPGEIRADGQFGPLKRDNVGQTVASGSYTFDHADLGVFPGIGGTLSSSGKFSGVLEQLEVAGTTDVPDFNVTTGGHTVELKTQFQAEVNGMDGDVSLKWVSAQFGHTSVVARGEVASKSGVEDGKLDAAGNSNTHGKTVSLTATEQQGTIQDWLLLLCKPGRPTLTGAMNFRTQIRVPPGTKSFIERVNLQGDFAIGSADFTKPATQAAVDNLSRVGLGEKQDNEPAIVTESMKGHAVMQNATTTFTDFYFGVPGAMAHMHGTYGILTQKIDLHGNLRVDNKLSKGSTGVKTVFLKVVEPLMKKKKGGEIVPVKIDGTYSHPSYGLDLVK